MLLRSPDTLLPSCSPEAAPQPTCWGQWLWLPLPQLRPWVQPTARDTAGQQEACAPLAHGKGVSQSPVTGIRACHPNVLECLLPLQPQAHALGILWSCKTWVAHALCLEILSPGWPWGQLQCPCVSALALSSSDLPQRFPSVGMGGHTAVCTAEGTAVLKDGAVGISETLLCFLSLPAALRVRWGSAPPCSPGPQACCL